VAVVRYSLGASFRLSAGLCQIKEKLSVQTLIA
jgi:hypothetical protein